MSNIQIDRRGFLKGCSAAALLTAGTKSYAMLDSTSAASQDTLVVVFLRGAMDALSLVSPGASNSNRAAYETARVSTRVPLTGTGAGLSIASGQWNLHPRATGLNTLYAQGHLAVVLGAGQKQPQPVVRSHFEAQSNLEAGLGGGSGSGLGWLTRHLGSAGLPTNVPVPSISMGSITASSLLGSNETITMNSGSDFRLDQGNWPWNSNDTDTVAGVNGLVQVLPSLWQSSVLPIAAAGKRTLEALAQFRTVNFSTYSASNTGGYKPSGSVVYPSTGFGSQLQNIAQLIKNNLGLRIVTLDLGGWDTHNDQGSPVSSYDYFGNQVQTLSDGLNAFYSDLAGDSNGNYMQHTSVVTVSEFGRRVLENASGGTDHGYGTVMFAMGAAVNGGKTYGTFPGLGTNPDGSNQLFEGADLTVTTDYRQVLSEAIIRRLANPNVYYVFPGYSGYTPLGIFQGTDLPPANYDAIFKNGFDA